jgi:hypothetical protein
VEKEKEQAKEHPTADIESDGFDFTFLKSRTDDSHF